MGGRVLATSLFQQRPGPAEWLLVQRPALNPPQQRKEHGETDALRNLEIKQHAFEIILV